MDNNEQTPKAGLSPRQLDELIRRELSEGGPRPAAPARPDRPLRPDVQRDLDALLGAIQADLNRAEEPK